MRFDQFTTDAFPVQQRPQVRREALNLHRLRPDIAPIVTPLHGTLTAGRSGRGVGMARITSSPQTLHRLGEETDALWLALHLRGDAAFDDGRQTVALATSDIVFGPAPASLKLDFRSNFRQFMVSMPASCLNSRPPGAPGNTLGHIPGRTGLGRLLSGTLTALADDFDTLGDGDYREDPRAPSPAGPNTTPCAVRRPTAMRCKRHDSPSLRLRNRAALKLQEALGSRSQCPPCPARPPA